jgi:hypothetical protein
MSFKYSYTKEVVIARLELEIRASSSIVHDLDHLTSLGTTVDIYFKAELGTAEVTELDAIVAAHVPTPMPEQATLVTLDTPKDAEGRQYTRNVITEPTWHYSPRSFDFYTAKRNSLYNRTHYCGAADNDATIDASPDMGDAALKFYDATNTLLVQGAEESDADFQIRLTANCYKTVLEFEPTFNYDIMGAKLQFRNTPADRAYFWFVAAPDVPAAYGGNVVFMGGGMNISFFPDRGYFECDGKSVSRVTYDGTYHSGKVALITKHNVGVQIGVQLILQFYSS